MKLVLVIFSCLLNIGLAQEQNDSFDYQIRGNTKTSKEAIYKLSRLHTLKKPLGVKEKNQVKNNLFQSGLFKNVNIESFEKERSQKIIIQVEERFTTIPIAKFNSGGGVSSTTLGVFDPNVFGEALEFGGQYTRLDRTNSGVLWHKNPFLGHKNWGYEIQLWKTNRLREKFAPKSKTPLITRGFLQTRDKYLLAVNYEWDSYNDIKIQNEYHRDSFSNRLVPPEVVGANNPLPINTRFNISSLEWIYDQFNYFSYDKLGLGFNLKISHAQSLISHARSFHIFESNFEYSQRMRPNLLFASRLQLGATNTDTLQYWFYRGGLAGIRGFSDNRFAGRYLTLWNSELRSILLERPTFIIQGAGFIDLINVSENFATGKFLSGASSGLGLRLILPKLYRFVVRIDYAKPLVKEDDNQLNFGVQQFF